MKVIFSCLSLKPDDGFLPHSMPEIFNKTGHGLKGIIIVWDEVVVSVALRAFWA